MSATLRILLVEDNPGDSRLIEEMLRESGARECCLTHAKRLDEALNCLDREAFDVLLLDLGLPDSYGLDTFVRAHAHRRGVPIVVLSGLSDDAITNEAVRRGAQDYLVKGQVDGNVLSRAIRYAIERRWAQEALHESEKKYRTLFHGSLEAMSLTVLGKIVDANPAWLRLHGFESKEEVIGMDVIDIIHPDDRKLLVERRRMGDRERLRVCEFRDIRKDGSVVHVEVYSSMVGLGGMAKAIVTTVRDVTERKRAEEALRESEERYRSMVETAEEGVWMIDSESRTTFVNPKMANMLGYTVQEMMGESLFRFMDDEGRRMAEANVQRRRRGIREQHEFTFRRKDGTNLVGLLSTAPAMDNTGRYFGALAMVTDITEHRRIEREKESLQAQLMQSQKMEAIGRLAGGVAHDFNNLLTTIQGFTELAMLKIKKTEPLYQDLSRVHEAGKRAANLVRQLLLFSRRQPMELVPIDLNAAIADLLKMLRRLIGEDVEVIADFAPDLRRIRGDAGNIEQVIMNLAVNARDAMPNGGTLTVRTEEVNLDEAQCRAMSQARPGRFARLSVRDTGEGMSAEVLAHIFEPFFSTKAADKGTGLGLSVVYGIVERHGGWITVESEPGQGATFKIYLPLAESGAETAVAKSASPHEIMGHGERILLVEDEDGVRDVAAQTLSAHGYAVFQAANAKQAMEIFTRQNKDIDILFSDVVLPDMDGLRLVDELAALKPNLAVLLASGYTDEKSQWPLIREKGFRFIHKPYKMMDLLSGIKEATART